MDRFVVISGCSGGGKSTLLAELGRRGHAFVEEPGRRIVKEELKGAGSARLRSLCPTEDRGGGSRRLRPEGAGGVADPVGFGSESGLIRLAGQVEVREGLMDCGVTTWRAGRM